MKITRKQLRQIIRETVSESRRDIYYGGYDPDFVNQLLGLDRGTRKELEDAPVTATYLEQGYEDAAAGRRHRYMGADEVGRTNWREYLKGYNEGLGKE